jgi:hypothetical protein
MARFNRDDYWGLSRLENWTHLLSIVPLALGVAALLLSFGAANHRSADRTFARVGKQVLWILIYAVGMTMLVTFINQMLWAGAGFKRS